MEDVANPLSVTLLVKGPNAHTITQMKNALEDGLCACGLFDPTACMVPGAGAVEMAASIALHKLKSSVAGRARLGVQAFADALLVIPKVLLRSVSHIQVLANNSGFDAQETVVKLQEASAATGEAVGVDLSSGEPVVPGDVGIFDNYIVKRSLFHSWYCIQVFACLR